MHKTITSLLYAAIMMLPLLLTACHNDDDSREEAPVDILSRFGTDGKAWMCVNVKLTGRGAYTRAVDSFDDGDATEHAVKTITLVLLSGSREADATVATSTTYTLPDNDGQDPTITGPVMHADNQVTCTVQVSSEGIIANSRVYLLVLLNQAANYSVTTGKKLSDLNTTSTTAITTTFGDDTYYTMATAPLADACDGTGTVSTLNLLSPSFFFHTQQEAESNPAATVYVERSAVKVTVKAAETPPTTILGNPNITFGTTDLAYAIDNYNSNTTLVRCFNSDWLPYRSANGKPLRFVETTPLPTLPARYRTYWAQDQNYTGNSGLTYKTHAQRDDIVWKNMNVNSYCAENTFDAVRQQDDCTTSILVRLQLNNGGDFFTTSVTGSDIVYLPPRNTVSEEGTSASSSFSRTAGNASERFSSSTTTRSPAFNARTIDEYLRTWLMQVNPNFRSWVNTYAAGEPNHVSIAVDAATDWVTTGKATVKKVAQSAQAANSTGAAAFDALGLVNYINTNIILYYYNNGFCYYRVPLRHFTDAETEWQSTPQMTNNSTAQTYQADGDYTADKRYLGRYGLVRNNWYTVSIRTITHVGSPIIPALTQNADDRVEQLLNATLSIASWTSHDTPLTNP